MLNFQYILSLGKQYVLRPWKHRTKKKFIQLTFIFEGSVPSKKNNQVPLLNWSAADDWFFKIIRERPFTAKDYLALKLTSSRLVRPFIVPSKKHEKWQRRNLVKLIAQRDAYHARIAAKGLLWPLNDCSVKVRTWKSNNYIRDHTNRMESISDLLKKALIISDDNDDVLTPITLEAGKFVGEIRDHITVVYLTAYYQ